MIRLTTGKIRYTAYGPTDGWRERRLSDNTEGALGLMKKNSALPAYLMKCSSKNDIYAEEIEKEGLVTTDTVISNKHPAQISMTTADCVPLAIIDSVTGWWAFAHINWKGVLSDQVYKVVETIRTEGAGNPVEYQVIIGPAICPACYFSTGWRGFLRRIKYRLQGKGSLIKKTSTGRGLDLVGGVVENLLRAGVKKQNIQLSNICTSHDGWPSYRRSCGKLTDSILSVLEIE